MTYTLLFIVLLVMIVVGLGINWRQERAYWDKEFHAWLARGVHPSLRQFRERGTDES